LLGSTMDRVEHQAAEVQRDRAMGEGPLELVDLGGDRQDRPQMRESSVVGAERPFGEAGV
jgi:hypothetical protein